jgi:hypothetical protein
MEATCLEDRIVSALIKNGERFVIVCEVRQLPAALATLRRWAEDETINFSYDDCAKMSVGLCRQVKQLDLAPVFAPQTRKPAMPHTGISVINAALVLGCLIDSLALGLVLVEVWNWWQGK